MAQLLATSATPQREPFDHALTALLHDPNQYVIVAHHAADAVGYLHGLVHPAFHANGNIGWIEELFVDPDQRGTGLGRALVDNFEAWATEEHDAQYVAVSTRRAHEFYRAIGYAESATYFKKVLE